MLAVIILPRPLKMTTPLPDSRCVRILIICVSFAELDEEKKKNAELLEQISKLSEELRTAEERIANAPKAAVKAYQQSDAFYRYLSVRYDVGWVAVERCFKQAFPN